MCRHRKLELRLEKEKNELDAMLSSTEGVSAKAKDKLMGSLLGWKYGFHGAQ